MLVWQKNNPSPSITQITHPALVYRPDLQGLRAIAIMLVVLAHAGVSVFSGGFVGVDVFFVLSGYLITSVLVNEYASQGSIHLTGFFARRLKRLLPALLFMMSLVLLISSHLLSDYEVNEQTASSMYSATWTSNLFFAFSIVDYFSELRTKDLFLHTWSLGVEEQFYLAWSSLLWITLVFLTRMRGRSVHHRQLLMMFGAVFVGSFWLLWYWTARQALWAFYLMPSRIWQFALGAGVYVWLHGRNGDTVGIPTWELSRTWGAVSGISGCALILGSAVLLHPNMLYPGFWALLPSLGAALVIYAGHQRSVQGASLVLSHPLLVFIGDRSYSWYLWHWPVLMLGFSWGMQNHLAGTARLVSLSFLLAMLSYRWVERPFWKGRFSNAAPTQSILLSFFSMLAVILGVQNLPKHSSSELNKGARTVAEIARSDFPAIAGCDAGYKNAEVHPCVIGNPIAPKTVALIGDSIGTQWYAFLPGIFRTPEWRIVVLTKSSCPMIDESFFYENIGQIYTVCDTWRNESLNYLSSLRPNIIFEGSAATYNFSASQWTEGAARVLARLTTSADHVIVVPGTPNLSFDGPSCLTLHESTQDNSAHPASPFCREALTSTMATDVTGYLARAVARFPNAMLLDLNDLVCPGGYCAAQDTAGHVVFRDSMHLTNSFVQEQIPSVRQRLELLGLGTNSE